MLITFKTIEKNVFKVEFDETKTVWSLKQHIYKHDLIAIAPEMMQLFYGGQVLENKSQLNAYNIDSRLYVLVMINKHASKEEYRHYLKTVKTKKTKRNSSLKKRKIKSVLSKEQQNSNKSKSLKKTDTKSKSKLNSRKSRTENEKLPLKVEPPKTEGNKMDSSKIVEPLNENKSNNFQLSISQSEGIAKYLKRFEAEQGNKIDQYMKLNKEISKKIELTKAETKKICDKMATLEKEKKFVANKTIPKPEREKAGGIAISKEKPENISSKISRNNVKLTKAQQERLASYMSLSKAEEKQLNRYIMLSKVEKEKMLNNFDYNKIIMSKILDEKICSNPEKGKVESKLKVQDEKIDNNLRITKGLEEKKSAKIKSKVDIKKSNAKTNDEKITKNVKSTKSKEGKLVKKNKITKTDERKIDKKIKITKTGQGKIISKPKMVLKMVKEKKNTKEEKLNKPDSSTKAEKLPHIQKNKSKPNIRISNKNNEKKIKKDKSDQKMSLKREKTKKVEKEEESLLMPLIFSNKFKENILKRVNLKKSLIFPDPSVIRNSIRTLRPKKSFIKTAHTLNKFKTPILNKVKKMALAKSCELNKNSLECIRGKKRFSSTIDCTNHPKMNSENNSISPHLYNMMNPLSIISDDPGYPLLRCVIKQRPDLLTVVMAKLGRRNPELLQIIKENWTDFLSMINKHDDKLDSNDNKKMVNIVLTQKEADIVERLVKKGFQRGVVVEAFFACDRNEEKTLNSLTNKK